MKKLQINKYYAFIFGLMFGIIGYLNPPFGTGFIIALVGGVLHNQFILLNMLQDIIEKDNKEL